MKQEWNTFLGNRLKIYYSEGHLENHKESLKQLEYYNRQLYLNEKPVFSKLHDGVLFWNDGVDPKSDVSSGKSVGRLESINGQGLFVGTMFSGNDTINFKAAIDSKYEVVFTDNQHHSISYDLLLGSHLENGDLVQTIDFCEKGMQESIAICRMVSSVKEKDGGFHPHIYGTLLSGLKDFVPYTYFDLRIESDYIHISGSAWKNEEDHLTQPVVCNITGRYALDEVKHQDNDIIPAAIGCGIMHRHQLEQATLPCVESLFYMPMPVMENVNDDFPQKMTQLMLHGISDEQLEYIGKPNRPKIGTDLTQEMVDLLKKDSIKDFLTGKYYFACLSSLLANNDCGACTEMIRKVGSYSERLKGYYSDSLSTSMCKDPGYCELSQELYAMVYTQSLPEIKPYISQRKKWAEQLHRYALYMSPSNLMTEEYTHEAQSRLQHTVVILNYLCNDTCIKMDRPQDFSSKNQRNGVSGIEDYYISYGSDVYYKLINKWLTWKAFATTSSDLVMNKEHRTLYFETAGKKLLRSVYEGSYVPDYLKDLQEELKKAIEQKIYTCPEDAYAFMSVVFLELESIFAGVSDQCILPCIAKWLDTKCPRLSLGMRTGLLVIAQGLMLWNASAMLSNWDNLTDAQKAQSVLSVAYTITDCASVVYSIVDYTKLTKAAKVYSETVVKANPSAMAGNAEVSALSREGAKFSDKVKAAAAKMSTLTKFLGTLMAMLAFSMSICDIVNDMAIYGSASILCLDIIIAVVNGIGVISILVFSIILVKCSLASLLPGIGWACALLGILLSFILYFVKRNTKTKKEIYVERNCVTFLYNLQIPPVNTSYVFEYNPINCSVYYAYA